jgi:enoyl-CoA hydratase/3-hydroxyacyl-CoA dehydrogenase
MSILEVNDVESVTVVGAGTMGHGIAQVFATAGYKVTLVDIADEPLEAALENIEESLGRLGEDPEAVLARISTTTDRRGGLEEADVMVEAVPENIDLKEEVFADADAVLPAGAVLATNTSTLPITEIAAATDRPEQVVGMHFSNPVPLIPIVEVISGEETAEHVLEVTEALSEAVGKTSVRIEKDVPGFLLNRINYAFWNEALRRVDEGEFDTEAIDAAAQRLNFPMGPFEVLDFSGLDVFHMVCQSMRERGVPVRISECLEELIEADRYGMKTGEGFYEYPEAGTYARADIPRELRYEYDPYCMVASAVNEAAWLLANDVTTKEDIDTAMELGMSWPRGPLEFADEYGIDRIVDTLERLHEESGWAQYEPHPLLEAMVADGNLGQKTGEGFYDYDQEEATFGPVEYEKREYLAYVTLNRPEKLNALDKASWNGLRNALERAECDNDVRVTVLRGAGDAFSAGDDIAEMQEWESATEGQEFFETVVLPAVEALRTHSKPTVALVDGVATGAGCELALLSDLGVAAEGSQFGQPEATIGALPPLLLAYGATSVGKKTMLELAMTGDLFSAAEAADAGLVNYAVSRTQAPDVARELARSTTASAPGSIAAMKRLWSGYEEELAAAWRDEAVNDLTDQLWTEEGQHGLETFLGGGSPRWEQ